MFPTQFDKLRPRLLALVLCFALSGCGALLPMLAQAPPAPVTVADRTVLDEQALTALELAYKGGRIAAEAGVDLGFIRGEVAVKVAQIDDRAFKALGAARAAYRAGNAESYASALRDGQSAITTLLALAAK